MLRVVLDHHFLDVGQLVVEQKKPPLLGLVLLILNGVASITIATGNYMGFQYNTYPGENGSCSH